MLKFLIVLFVLTGSITFYGQWQPDQRFTNHPDSSLTSPNNARCIAASGNIIHTAWYDNRDGNYEIYYKRSTDDGLTWGADTRLTSDVNISIRPSVALSGLNVHLVWYDTRNGNEEIYYKRSADGGVSWGPDTRLTTNANNSILPSVSSLGMLVNVVWIDNRDGNYEVYYKRSTDAGISWGTDTRLTNNASVSLMASCVMSGSAIHVTWDDTRDGPNEIYYKRSTDDGLTWGPDTRLSNIPGVSWFPSIAVFDSHVQVSWVENSDGNPEIYSKRSTDAGITWEANIRQTNNTAVSIRPTISISGTYVHLVWEDNVAGNEEVYYKYSTNGGVSFSPDIRLTNDPAISVYPCHTVSVAGIHCLWRDFRDGNWEVYYKRNPTGNLVNVHTLSNELPSLYFLGQNYPNPFNPMTKLKFQIPNPGFVKLIIHDALGREIAVLVNEHLYPGTYEFDWNALNYPGGVYFYKLETDGFTETKRMMLIK